MYCNGRLLKYAAPRSMAPSANTRLISSLLPLKHGEGYLGFNNDDYEMHVSSMNIQSISEAEWNMHEQSLPPTYTQNYANREPSTSSTDISYKYWCVNNKPHKSNGYFWTKSKGQNAQETPCKSCGTCTCTGNDVYASLAC